MNGPQKRTSLYVQTDCGAVLTEVLAELRGLAVTSTTLASSDGWTVTHVLTGIAFTTQPLREPAARSLLAELAGLRDWEAIGFDGLVRLKQDKAQGARIRRAVARAQAEDAS